MSVAEALIGVAILSLLIAVFAPAAIQRQIYANELIAVSSLRAIVSSCSAFFSAQRPHRYPARLSDLGAPGEGLLDSGLAAGTKAGYVFSLVSKLGDSELPQCAAEGHPLLYRRQGVRSVFLDQTGRLLAEDVGGRPGHPTMTAWADESL
jgi:hypothetical protein